MIQVSLCGYLPQQLPHDVIDRKQDNFLVVAPVYHMHVFFYRVGKHIESLLLFFPKERLLTDCSLRVLPDKKIKTDLVVISNNSVKALETLCAYFDFSLLVIDSSNSTYRSQKLTSEAERLHIPYHTVTQQGALTLHIQD